MSIAKRAAAILEGAQLYHAFAHEPAGRAEDAYRAWEVKHPDLIEKAQSLQATAWGAARA
jgi:hypothetical protein